MPTYKYPRPAVTADIVLLAEGSVLLIERGNDPYKGCWAFPGGFLEEGETIDECARRELREETGLDIGGLRQAGVFSRPGRDPRGWTVTVAFVAELPSRPAASAGDDAARARWFALNALPPLAFDHSEILQSILQRP